jgi:hypothetical protein
MTNKAHTCTEEGCRLDTRVSYFKPAYLQISAKLSLLHGCAPDWVWVMGRVSHCAQLTNCVIGLPLHPFPLKQRAMPEVSKLGPATV